MTTASITIVHPMRVCGPCGLAIEGGDTVPLYHFGFDDGASVSVAHGCVHFITEERGTPPADWLQEAYVPPGAKCTGTITAHDVGQRAEYEALSAADRDRLWEGGDIRGITSPWPVRCDYDDQPAVWASVNGPGLRLACSAAAHIAWSQSVGGACPVNLITREHGYPVDEATCPPQPECGNGGEDGCHVYAETDGMFTTVHDRNCPQPPHYYDEPDVPVPAGLLSNLLLAAGFVAGGCIDPGRFNLDEEFQAAAEREGRVLFARHAGEWQRRTNERAIGPATGELPF